MILRRIGTSLRFVQVSLFLTTIQVSGGQGDTISSSSLPEDHLRRQFGVGGLCWGHEEDCRDEERSFGRPKCSKALQAHTGRKARDVFYEQADFGYLKKISSSMETLCHSQDVNSKDKNSFSSSLSCSKDLLFCRGRHIFFDLREVQDEDRSLKYQMNILKEGHIAGNCERGFDRERLRKNSDFMSALQSWAPELRFFEDRGASELECDVVVERPTFVMKLDATVNMYHHFCDFFNLYASMHLNASSNFNPDVNILIWDNAPYRSNLLPVFSAFTSNPLLDLNSFGRSRVCFADLVLALNPRMVFGLFYNTPLVEHCERSGLFRAFSEFLTFRLKVRTPVRTDKTVLRVTLISRQTRHRRILNEEELVTALKATRRFEVTVARFTHRTDFVTQLSTVHSSDILVGMHGAGLTHGLFLPDWGVLFELYHCEDPGCYRDLARLRGVGYVGWSNDTLLGKVEERGGGPAERSSSDAEVNAKFSNYSFDVEEFLRKVDEAARMVVSHPEFKSRDLEKDEL